MSAQRLGCGTRNVRLDEVTPLAEEEVKSALPPPATLSRLRQGEQDVTDNECVASSAGTLTLVQTSFLP